LAIWSNTLSNFTTQTVLSVKHWDDRLFSFRTSRDAGLVFHNGQFVMIGLEVDGKPLVRAYSVASPNYEEHLEFLSIKVHNGPLTSRLQHLQPGDQIVVSRKPTGTLMISDLKPGKHLYLMSTGTGLAPFLSIIQDPDTYERFEKVILVHGVRRITELAYAQYITAVLPRNEHLGPQVRNQLIYYPTVTRERFWNEGRLTEKLKNGELPDIIGLPPLNPETDRAMICGSPEMLKECSDMLDSRGFRISGHIGDPGDYVIERAFVEK